MNGRRVARAFGLYSATLLAAVAAQVAVMLALGPLVGAGMAALVSFAVAALVGHVSGSLWLP